MATARRSANRVAIEMERMLLAENVPIDISVGTEIPWNCTRDVFLGAIRILKRKRYPVYAVRRHNENDDKWHVYRVICPKGYRRRDVF